MSGPTRTARPSSISPERQRVRCSESAHTASRREPCTGPSLSRSTASSRRGTGGRCRPRPGPAAAGRRTPGGRPRARRSWSATGQSPHRGRRARCRPARRAPSRATDQVAAVGVVVGQQRGRDGRARRRSPTVPGTRRPPRPGRAPGARWCRARRAAARRRTSRPRPRCSRRRPGSASSSSYAAGHLAAVPLDDRGRRGVQPQRAARVAEPAPGAHRLTGGSAARSAGVGQRSSHASCTGQHPGDRRLLQHELARPAPTTGDADGPRQGRSRACSSYHSSSGSVQVGHRAPFVTASERLRRGYPLRALRTLPSHHAVDDAWPAAARRVLAPPAGRARLALAAGRSGSAGARRRQRRLVRRRQGDAGRAARRPSADSRRASRRRRTHRQEQAATGKEGKGKHRRRPDADPDPSRARRARPAPCGRRRPVTPSVDGRGRRQPVTIVLDLQTGATRPAPGGSRPDTVTLKITSGARRHLVEPRVPGAVPAQDVVVRAGRRDAVDVIWNAAALRRRTAPTAPRGRCPASTTSRPRRSAASRPTSQFELTTPAPPDGSPQTAQARTEAGNAERRTRTTSGDDETGPTSSA